MTQVGQVGDDGPIWVTGTSLICVVLPSAVQVSLYFLSTCSSNGALRESVSLPEVDFTPDQSPLAVHTPSGSEKFQVSANVRAEGLTVVLFVERVRIGSTYKGFGSPVELIATRTEEGVIIRGAFAVMG